MSLGACSLDEKTVTERSQMIQELRKFRSENTGAVLDAMPIVSKYIPEGMHEPSLRASLAAIGFQLRQQKEKDGQGDLLLANCRLDNRFVYRDEVNITIKIDSGYAKSVSARIVLRML